MSILGKRKGNSFGSNDNNKIKKRKLDAETFVKWNLWSGEKHWTLTVFKGTPARDIMENIVRITGIPSDKIVCKCEDGSLIALSSHLPNGMKIIIEESGKSKNVKILLLKTLTSKIISIEVEPFDTIEEVKAKVEKQEGMKCIYKCIYLNLK